MEEIKISSFSFLSPRFLSSFLARSREGLGPLCLPRLVRFEGSKEKWRERNLLFVRIHFKYSSHLVSGGKDLPLELGDGLARVSFISLERSVTCEYL